MFSKISWFFFNWFPQGLFIISKDPPPPPKMGIFWPHIASTVHGVLSGSLKDVHRNNLYNWRTQHEILTPIISITEYTLAGVMQYFQRCLDCWDSSDAHIENSYTWLIYPVLLCSLTKKLYVMHLVKIGACFWKGPVNVCLLKHFNSCMVILLFVPYSSVKFRLQIFVINHVAHFDVNKLRELIFSVRREILCK
jgi:hypothetical protein